MHSLIYLLLRCEIWHKATCRTVCLRFISIGLANQTSRGHYGCGLIRPSTAMVSNRPWLYPHVTGFAGMQNINFMGPWNIPIRFQGKASQARLLMAGSESLRVAHERMLWEWRQTWNWDHRKLEIPGMWKNAEGNYRQPKTVVTELPPARSLYSAAQAFQGICITARCWTQTC